MKRMHALFAALALCLVALIARSASAYAPKGGFNTLRTESDGSPIVQIGENCKLYQLIENYGPMYKIATGADLTYRVIRAANPEHTIPVCLVKGDGAIKIGRASEKVWENCPADQQSIYLIAGVNDAIRIPMGKNAMPLEPQVSLVAPENPEMVQLKADAKCFHSDPCLVKEAKSRGLFPVAPSAPIPVAEKAPIQQPAPKASPVSDTSGADGHSSTVLSFALLIAVATSITFLSLWRSAIAELHLKTRLMELREESVKRNADSKRPTAPVPQIIDLQPQVTSLERLVVDLQKQNTSLHEQADISKAEALTAWAKVEELQEVRNNSLSIIPMTDEPSKTVRIPESAQEPEKAAQETLRLEMLRKAREEHKLTTVSDHSTLRELFWKIDSAHKDRILLLEEQIRDTNVRNALSQPDTEPFRSTLMNIAKNKRHLDVLDNMSSKEILIAVDRSYEAGLRDVNSLLTTSKSHVEKYRAETEVEKAARTKAQEDAQKHRDDAHEARQLADEALKDRDQAQRSEREWKEAVAEYAIVLQQLTVLERRLIKNDHDIRQKSELSEELMRQELAYQASDDQQLAESMRKNYVETTVMIGRLLQSKQDLEQQTSDMRVSCDALEEKLGFKFSSKAIADEVDLYRIEALEKTAAADRAKNEAESKLTQIENELRMERALNEQLGVLKQDLEKRLADKELELSRREGAVQGLFTEVLTFCDMDPEADVERIHEAGGPKFLIDQMRLRMKNEFQDELAATRGDLETARGEISAAKRELSIVNELLEERNGEVQELCKEIDRVRAEASITAAERTESSSDESGVRTRLPAPEDLVRYALSDDTNKTLDYALALIEALPNGTMFSVSTTEDLVRLNQLAQIPVQLPKDIMTLCEVGMREDPLAAHQMQSVRTLFRDFRVHSVAKFVEANGQYLKGFRTPRRHTIMGVAAQSAAPTNTGSSIQQTLVPTLAPSRRT